MNNLSSPFEEAFSEVNDGGFLEKVLELAYDPLRFKQYARNVGNAKKWIIEDAANEVIWQTSTKTAALGGVLGWFDGFAALFGAGAVEIASSIYLIIEMCGVLAELHGYDTSDDTVKAFVMAGASGDLNLMSEALLAVELDRHLKSAVKSLLVPILKALGFKVGVKGGIKLALIVPVVGGAIGAGINFHAANKIGHDFINKLKRVM